MKEMRSYVAEAIAVLALVFVGGAAILSENTLLGVAFAHGIILMCMVYATGHVSGAHINPAVTISMWVTKNIEGKKAVGYIIAQLIGGTVGAFLLSLAFSDPGNYGGQALANGVTPLTGIIVEAILTFFLVFVIFATAVDKKAPGGIYGVAIGFVIAADILAGGSLTGASMNPARSFGPALLSGVWTNHFVYWVGPIIGGIVGGITYNKIMLGR